MSIMSYDAKLAGNQDPKERAYAPGTSIVLAMVWVWLDSKYKWQMHLVHML